MNRYFQLNGKTNSNDRDAIREMLVSHVRPYRAKTICCFFLCSLFYLLLFCYAWFIQVQRLLMSRFKVLFALQVVYFWFQGRHVVNSKGLHWNCVVKFLFDHHFNRAFWINYWNILYCVWRTKASTKHLFLKGHCRITSSMKTKINCMTATNKRLANTSS